MKIIFLLVFFLLFKENSTQGCLEPNEEFIENGCERTCSLLTPDTCRGTNIISKCFCKNGTVRNGRGECITEDECTQELCIDPGAKFYSVFRKGRVCGTSGQKRPFSLHVPVSSCECKKGFIHSCKKSGKCIPEEECNENSTQPYNCKKLCRETVWNLEKISLYLTRLTIKLKKYNDHNCSNSCST